MPIQNIALLLPGDDPLVDNPTETFQLTLLAEGQFRVSGPAPTVSAIDASTYQLSTSAVSENGDGSFTISTD